jgi:hypothetical protein
MNKFRLRLSVVALEELEESWRLKTDRAQKRYQVATERYKKLLKESQGLLLTADNRLALARQAQSAALDEYRRLLKLFSELTINSRVPEGLGNSKRGCDSERDASDFGG